MSNNSTFDYMEHNQKIAAIRGKEWKKALQKKKLEACENPTSMRIRRVALGISQMDMLRLVGIETQTSYARIERGTRFVDKHMAFKIAKVLSTKPDNLFLCIEKGKYLAI